MQTRQFGNPCYRDPQKVLLVVDLGPEKGGGVINHESTLGLKVPLKEVIYRYIEGLRCQV